MNLLKGDPRDILDFLKAHKVTYYYDCGDFYITSHDYSRFKNRLAYYGVI